MNAINVIDVTSIMLVGRALQQEWDVTKQNKFQVLSELSFVSQLYVVIVLHSFL
jgi:hypothetical protein